MTIFNIFLFFPVSSLALWCRLVPASMPPGDTSMPDHVVCACSNTFQLDCLRLHHGHCLQIQPYATTLVHELHSHSRGKDRGVDPRSPECLTSMLTPGAQFLIQLCDEGHFGCPWYGMRICAGTPLGASVRRVSAYLGSPARSNASPKESTGT